MALPHLQYIITNSTGRAKEAKAQWKNKNIVEERTSPPSPIPIVVMKYIFQLDSIRSNASKLKRSIF